MNKFLALTARCPAKTLDLGQKIGALLQPGDCLCLHGPLGAGKTALARGLIRGVMQDDALEVPSPTFTLVQQYEGRLSLAHADLYRIEHESELYELGLEDALEIGVTLVEWPERAPHFWPDDHLSISIQVPNTGGRIFILEGGAAWRARFASWSIE